LQRFEGQTRQHSAQGQQHPHSWGKAGQKHFQNARAAAFAERNKEGSNTCAVQMGSITCAVCKGGSSFVEHTGSNIIVAGSTRQRAAATPPFVAHKGSSTHPHPCSASRAARAVSLQGLMHSGAGQRVCRAYNKRMPSEC